MQDFYGHAIAPPKFQWQAAAPRHNAKAGTVPPTDALDPQVDEHQADFFPTDFAPELTFPDPDSGPTRSTNTGFGGPAPTPPSYSNETRPHVAETPEQPRRLSQKLPVSP